MEQQFLDAIHAGNWYAVAALVIFAAIFAFKKSAILASLWYRIPESARLIVPLVAGAATAFADAFFAGLSLERALIAALAGALFIGGPAMGLQSAWKESLSKLLPTPAGEKQDNGNS